VVAHQDSAFASLKAKVASGLRVWTDSRRVRPGDVFVALPGVRVDGTAFIPDAVERGAGYVVAGLDAELPAGAEARLVRHERPRQALGELAAAYFDDPSSKVELIGITGTNGKTTVSYMLEHMLSKAGRRVGVIGTISYRWPGFHLDAPLTTPDCWQVHELLSNMLDSGVDTVIMECSSHALHQERLAGLKFDAAVLTNVTQDHLDYHGTMDHYFRAKTRLFLDQPNENKVGIINFDDAYGRMLQHQLENTVGYGLKYPNTGGGPGLSGYIKNYDRKGLHLAMSFEGQRWEIKSPLVGRFNASNLMAAQAVGLSLGLRPRRFLSLESFNGVPGRLERVPNTRGLDVFVDYAHTPDALDNALSALRELDFKRILCVFGCGGNRDKTKRPLMGEAVCRYADVAVLTSDNPRDEDPVEIMKDIKPGLAACAGVMEEPQRRKAIKMALEEMEPGDCLLIAGKGHETYQEIKGRRYPFSDVEAAKEFME
jgi:UDP-N-acetylmuramoyl-L-alanyl-D-glutamate--2,6-diaminopimelate ligase